MYGHFHLHHGFKCDVEVNLLGWKSSPKVVTKKEKKNHNYVKKRVIECLISLSLPSPCHFVVPNFPVLIKYYILKPYALYKTHSMARVCIYATPPFNHTSLPPPPPRPPNGRGNSLHAKSTQKQSKLKRHDACHVFHHPRHGFLATGASVSDLVKFPPAATWFNIPPPTILLSIGP